MASVIINLTVAHMTTGAYVSQYLIRCSCWPSWAFNRALYLLTSQVAIFLFALVSQTESWILMFAGTYSIGTTFQFFLFWCVIISLNNAFMNFSLSGCWVHDVSNGWWDNEMFHVPSVDWFTWFLFHCAIHLLSFVWSLRRIPAPYFITIIMV